MSSVEDLPSMGQALVCLAAGCALLAPALAFSRRRLLPAPPRPPDPRWRAGEVLAVVVGAFLLLTVLGALAEGASLLVGLLLTEVALGAAVAHVLLLARARPPGLGLGSLGLAVPARRRAMLAGPLCFVGLWPCLLGLGLLWLRVARRLGWPEEQEVLELILALRGVELALAWVLAVGVGPFLEELLFRGFLQVALARPLGERAGIVASSALFALLHGPSALLPIFVLSLFLGWLQVRTRSLLVPWSVHALNNALVLTLALAVSGR